MKLLVVPLLLVSLFSAAQKIEQYYDYAWQLTDDPGIAVYYAVIEKHDSLWARNDYFMRELQLQIKGAYLDRETNIAHGLFHFYHVNGALRSVDSFSNEKKMDCG